MLVSGRTYLIRVLQKRLVDISLTDYSYVINVVVVCWIWNQNEFDSLIKMYIFVKKFLMIKFYFNSMLL